jgi:hypothetical protein
MLTSKSGGSYQSSFVTAGVLLLVGAALTSFITSSKSKAAAA